MEKVNEKYSQLQEETAKKFLPNVVECDKIKIEGKSLYDFLGLKARDESFLFVQKTFYHGYSTHPGREVEYNIFCRVKSLKQLARSDKALHEEEVRVNTIETISFFTASLVVKHHDFFSRGHTDIKEVISQAYENSEKYIYNASGNHTIDSFYEEVVMKNDSISSDTNEL